MSDAIMCVGLEARREEIVVAILEAGSHRPEILLDCANHGARVPDSRGSRGRLQDGDGVGGRSALDLLDRRGKGYISTARRGRNDAARTAGSGTAAACREDREFRDADDAF